MKIKIQNLQLEISRLACVKYWAGIIVSKNVVLERKASLFDTAEIYQPILLFCLRFIIMFKSCSWVQAGWWRGTVCAAQRRGNLPFPRLLETSQAKSICHYIRRRLPLVSLSREQWYYTQTSPRKTSACPFLLFLNCGPPSDSLSWSWVREDQEVPAHLAQGRSRQSGSAGHCAGSSPRQRFSLRGLGC